MVMQKFFLDISLSLLKKYNEIILSKLANFETFFWFNFKPLYLNQILFLQLYYYIKLVYNYNIFKTSKKDFFFFETL